MSKYGCGPYSGGGFFHTADTWAAVGICILCQGLASAPCAAAPHGDSKATLNRTSRRCQRPSVSICAIFNVPREDRISSSQAAVRRQRSHSQFQFSFLIQILRTETLAGVPSSSIPILPDTLFDEAGSSSISTAITWPLRIWIIVPPRATISYWFQSLILT